VTKRAGVIGHPLGHSISPAVYRAAFEAAGVDAVYEAWDTPEDTLQGRVDALRGADFLGANVTIPHKQAVLPMLDGTSEVAGKAGAVNTIVHQDDGKLIGHNTDVAGFARSLKEDAKFDAVRQACVVLGSGGAARAVALALIEAQASTIFVFGRKPRKIDQLVLQLKPLTPSGTTISWAYWGDGSFLRALGNAGLVVNCTPIGTAGSARIEAGELVPQSRASAFAVALLDPRPGERVLDLCAGPGIKTTQIAARIANEGVLVAVERDAGRASELRALCARLGASSVRVIEADAARDDLGDGYDRVLVDPPCSDLGTLASRPDARWRKSLDGIAGLARLQAQILERGAAALRPGGTLVYSTCTISRLENEDTVVAALQAAGPEVGADELGSEHPGLASAHDPRFVQTRPDRDRTDGFFIARLRRGRG